MQHLQRQPDKDKIWFYATPYPWRTLNNNNPQKNAFHIPNVLLKVQSLTPTQLPVHTFPLNAILQLAAIRIFLDEQIKN